ncbi:TPA: hypothetical protein N0F65_008196 [Lagenidium giganteum]|uniref:Uncharacterized protein n=1 Tax=Lagenidium giganteum TaxID=4803 RepID=A0AAV2YK75_9STRA|nr:TPA: hypothetical protein N0F65_008196 [Lagenidium giganteum]
MMLARLAQRSPCAVRVAGTLSCNQRLIHGGNARLSYSSMRAAAARQLVERRGVALAPQCGPSRVHILAPSSFALAHIRFYRGGHRNPWEKGDLMSKVKTGALVMLGAGALVASTSVAFGLIITAAAGYGIYTLYQKIMGPFRARSGFSNDPFDRVNADIDRLSRMFGNNARGSNHAQYDPYTDHRQASAKNDVDALVQGLPFVVRGFVKTIFSFVGSAMQNSMKRAGELRRMTNEYVRNHPRVQSQMGGAVEVSTPQQWMESSVNGVGSVNAVFPIQGSHGSAQVSVKATVQAGGQLSLQQLKYRNNRTGEVIDLLRDQGPTGPRKTVIDAEYVDLDDSKSRRW